MSVLKPIGIAMFLDKPALVCGMRLAILILAMLFLSSCAINQNIDASEALAILEENEGNPDFVLLDVRTPDEFSKERIEGAINIDYYNESFRDDISALDRRNIYLVYCGSGKRGGMALDVMNGLGFQTAYNIEGGIEAAKNELFEIITQDSSCELKGGACKSACDPLLEVSASQFTCEDRNEVCCALLE
jgi:rhodanese-related sulfurtransferase